MGVKLRIVFNIKQEGTAYSATMDSPDQGAKGIPVSSVSLHGDSLHLEVAVANGSFGGKLTSDTTIEGTWNQGPANLPLTLTKTTKAIEPRKRPQTPKSPFAYRSEEVEYDHSGKSVHLAGTFTYPSTGNHFPVAILISGSGQQDRDETIFEHKPFAVIADYLTNKGYAVLRVDDRGTGKSTGVVQHATSEDFAKDVEAGIAYLKKRPEVDTNRIGLIGHSEGGHIASMLAGRRKDIAFIVLLASPGVKGLDLLAEQNVAVLTSSGVSAKAAESYKSLFTQVADAAITNNADVANQKAFQAYDNWKTTTPQQYRDELGIKDDNAAKEMLHAQIEGFSSPWMKYFLQGDASQFLRKTSAAVLALNGEKDIQVLPHQNLPGIIKALEQSKSKVYFTKVMPGLNHLFQKCSKCTVQEYQELEETFSPDALAEIGNWLDKNIKPH